jgi:hypothetical protein
MQKMSKQHKTIRTSAYRPVFRPEDLIRLSYDGDEVPETPPHPNFRWGDALTIEQGKLMVNAVIPPFHVSISFDLLDAAWRLVRLSWQRCGNCRDGLEPPANSLAAAAGAITVATAAFEAALNESVYKSSHLQVEGPAQRRLYDLALGLSLRHRMEAFAALHGHVIDWGSRPFQELDLIITARRFLLHHEAQPYDPAGGFWPAKALKQIPRLTGSPYKEADLEWQQHLLTPTGAEWVVRAVFDVVGWIDRWVDPEYYENLAARNPRERKRAPRKPQG